MRKAIRFVFASAALGAAGAAFATNPATTPIQHVIVLFQENVSFDHYFATYPNAQNNSGEQIFTAYPGTPTVNGLTPDLLKNNPNLNAAGTAKVNPPRLSPAQAYTCSQNHSYGPEQQALDAGLLDQFPKFTGRTTSEGCATDGSTVLGYYDGNTVAAYWNYAQNFALNDNSFGSTFGPSTPGAINLISGNTANATTHFGTSTTNTFPSAVGSNVTDIGDLDAYLDDCGNDKGGTVTTTTTMEMNSDVTAATGNRNIGDLLNAAGVTWGWFQGGFRPTTPSVSGSLAVCGASRTAHQYPSTSPTVVVPEPAAPFLTGPTIHTPIADYSSHHQPFMYYASTRNPHHLPPTSAAAVGTTDQANHQYDTLDFVAALNAGNLPAVSFIKAPEAYDGHPGYSDPTLEQYWITEVINAVMQSQFWSNTAIIIAYDDSDGWYDHVTGPVVSPSKTSADSYAAAGNCGNPVSGAQAARCGYGPRLPLIVISPYANPNFVDHTVTNQTSIANFIESNWSLGFIDGPTPPAAGVGSFDRLSGSLNGLFNFSNPPNTSPLLLTCSGAYASSPATACALDPTP